MKRKSAWITKSLISTKGITSVEVLLVATLLGVLVVISVVPYLKTSHTTFWETDDRRSEVLQNARIGMDKMTNEIKQAQSFVAVSIPTEVNGYIEFVDKDGNNMEFSRYYDNTAGGYYLGYGVPGTPLMLAGPIDSLKFTCYKKDNVTQTTAPDKIRLIEIELTVSDSEGKVAPVTLTAKIFFRRNNTIIPASIRAVIVAGGPVQTLGGLIVDGRNHGFDGTFLIPNTGVLGVSTTQTYAQSGSSTMGGTDSSGVDYSPLNPGDAEIIEENADWSGEGGFPDTPDEVMEENEGTLKAIAQSGANGSQYVTDPNNLIFPLSGVTYVELDDEEVWTTVHFDDSSGILVVHNTTTNAVIKNLNSGNFRGLIIADDITHINNTIVGAVVVLTSTPSEGNCIGNGNGDVLYSIQAIKKGIESCQ